MSYAMSAALQAGVYQTLATDPALSGLVGSAIFDALPPGTLPSTYVTLGEEDVKDRSDMSGAGAIHDFVVRIVTDASGFQGAKSIAGAVSDALLAEAPGLTRGRVVGLWFLKARARRVGSGDQRQIELRFRAQIQDD